ncbi:MAG: DUF4882 family protein [Acinetobacter sp.]
MKRIIMGMVLGGATISSWAACNYDFDATQAQVSSVMPGLNVTKMTNLSKSKVQAIVSSTSGTDFFVAMSSDIATKKQVLLNNNSYALPVGDLIIPTSGVLVYEYELKAPINLNSGEKITVGPLFGVGTSGSSGSSGVLVANYEQSTVGVSGYNNAQITDNQVYSSTGTGVNRIGIYFDQTAKQWGTIINGINKGYIGTLNHAVDNYSFQFSVGISGVSTTSTSIGKVVSLELITDKNQFQFTYPSGAKDICGNTI